MTTSRLEAFSDGVIAIIITIMVLELKPPAGSDFRDLVPLMPVFTGYLLSFIFLGIYWSNHHHLLHTATKVTGGVLWANLHLLFWLSLVPFMTAWIGEHKFSAVPVAVYGIVLLFAAIAYYILARILAISEGPDSKFARAIGNDYKGQVSIIIYAIAIGASQWSPILASTLYGVVALMWLVPDRRFERENAEGS